MRAAFRVMTAIVLTVLVGCAPAGPSEPAGPPPDNALQSELIAGVTGEHAFTYLEELQRIADRNGGNRASPGPGYDASVDYVAGVLRGAGYQVSTPTFQQDGRTVRNVVAQTRTGDPQHVVMAGAHLDSVPDGPGINDNGSGTAALLEIAVRMGGSPPVRNAVRFAWWGGEEDGMLGSTHYVDTLGGDDRDWIALYLNLDMVASPNAGYLVQGGEGRRERSSGPAGSKAVADVLVEQLAATGVEAQTTGFQNDSDYAPFVDAGIASGGALTGDSDSKTAEQAARWGGQAGVDFDPCYHSACDRLGNIDATALDRYTDAVAGTMAYFVMSTDRLTQ